MTDKTEQHAFVCPSWSDPRTDGEEPADSKWLQRQHLGGQAIFLRIKVKTLKDLLAKHGTISGRQLADASKSQGGYWNFLDRRGNKNPRLVLENQVGLPFCAFARETLSELLASVPPSLGICICFDEWQVDFSCLDYLHAGFMLGEPTQ